MINRFASETLIFDTVGPRVTEKIIFRQARKHGVLPAPGQQHLTHRPCTASAPGHQESLAAPSPQVVMDGKPGSHLLSHKS